MVEIVEAQQKYAENCCACLDEVARERLFLSFIEGPKKGLGTLVLQRISIVGTSGSGKTTLAKKLAAILALPHYELDAFNWMPNWQARDPEEFREMVLEKANEPLWVTEGNYGRVRGEIWKRADTVIWINLPFRVVFTRMLLRIFKRKLENQILWNGNRETLSKHFFTKESMLLWVIKTYSRRKREYRKLFQDPGFNHLDRREFGSQREVDKFVEGLASRHKYPL